LPTLRARSLSREYRLHSACAEGLGRLSPIECSPDIGGAVLDPIDIAVDECDGFQSLAVPDARPAKGTPVQIIVEWRRFLLRQAGRDHAGLAFLPAASIIGRDGRVLLVGGQRSGRTTLAVQMLMRGFAVEGDDHTLVDWGAIIAHPSRIFAASDLPRLVPAAGALFEAAPKQRNWSGEMFAAIDPTLPGRPWRIDKGPVTRLIFLELNSGGRSVLGPLSPELAFARMMSLALMPDDGVALAAARLRGLAMAVPASALSLGDLDGAAWHIERATGPGRC
jgi:hypothetical protein